MLVLLADTQMDSLAHVYGYLSLLVTPATMHLKSRRVSFLAQLLS